MSLCDLTLNLEYDTGDDLIGTFYAPCLKEATKYDRAVGYFRSTVFLLIGPEFLEFAKKGGSLRLACSPVMSPQDIEVISNSYEEREKYIHALIDKEVDEILNNQNVIKNTEALATLIKLGVIDIKIVTRLSAEGSYHSKRGIFTDAEDNKVVFKGSINETWNGWNERGNEETFDVYPSWGSGTDIQRVIKNVTYFEDLWNGRRKNTSIDSFPEAAKKKLLSVAKDSLDDIDPSDLENHFRTKRAQTKEKEVGNFREPFKFQSTAIKNWEKQGFRGLIKFATGSGKTFTALLVIKDHIELGAPVLIIVPDTLLLSQWESEVKKEIPDALILKAGDGNNRWKKNHTLSSFTANVKTTKKRIVLATIDTARTDEFIYMINTTGNLLIVGDEVHEFGSHQRSNVFNIDASRRLGLSATPERYNDPEGTRKIFDYFGPAVEPEFTLEDALREGRLVPYEYFPEIVHLSAEEAEEWREISKKIKRAAARSLSSDEGGTMDTLLQRLLIQRSRIAKKAHAKIQLAVDILRKNYEIGQSWLVYCEDQTQLSEVKIALAENGIDSLEYHTGMVSDKEASLVWFKKNSGILLAIRCLDQGVDIPSISHAIILASSQNPREFIQRRGRVLRKHPGKYKAIIYDAIVSPVDEIEKEEQYSLLISEISRSIQFAKMALNSSSWHLLEQLAIKYEINLNDEGMLTTYGLEED